MRWRATRSVIPRHTGYRPLLDLAGILFSSIMLLIVITRAVQLDRTRPWFAALSTQDAARRGSEATPSAKKPRRPRQ